jgi:predicted secreted protein
LRTRKLLALSLLACLSAALPLPAGADSGDHDSARNRASFEVEVVREIANDWVTARLSVMAEGKDPAAVADEVNSAMAKAIEAAKQVEEVELQSGAYVTQPVYDEGTVVRWRAQQLLRLESSDVDALSELIGRLQSDSVLLSGIDFSVRRVTRKALEDELIEDALGQFRARAKLIARGMGSRDWSLIQISVGSTGGAPHRVMMERDTRMMSRASAAPPAFEAGTSEVRIRVSGTVELD